MRPALALVSGAAAAFACAVVLGEYAVTLLTGLAAGLVVPAVVGEVVRVVSRRRPRWLGPACASVLGAPAVALGVWFAGGRGLQAWPVGGTVAVVLAALWPVGAAVTLLRGGAPVSRR